MASSYVAKGRKILVLGANLSAVSILKVLIRKGASPVLVDSKSLEDIQMFLSDKMDLSKIEIVAGGPTPQTFEGAACVVVTPGIPLDLKVLEAARAAGIPVVSELEFAAPMIDEPMIGVGGTKGKTTAALLIKDMIEQSGLKAFANADSVPLSDYLLASKPSDVVVTIANSFQLEGTQNFQPQTIVLTNYLEDHADRYPNFESYLAANREILKNANETTTVILNADEAHVAPLAAQAKGRVLFFSQKEIPEGFEGAWLEKNILNVRLNGQNVISFNLQNFRIRGAHSRENLAAAVLAALIHGAKVEAIQKTIENFRALSGRMEFVRRMNSVVFYNDSAGATPHSVLRAIQSFNEPIILIMGGRDKNLDFSALIPHVRHRVKNLIVLGESKEKVNRVLGDFTETFLVGTLEEAVLMAYQKSRLGDVILLSPGCDSRDVYADHVDRGDSFRNLVNQIGAVRKVTFI